jgi:uncharacterized protein (TIGR02246 family)
MLSLTHVGAVGVLVLAAATQTMDDDERVIRGMVAQAVDRLNRGDVTAFDAFWDDTADYVGVNGRLVRGKAAIQALFRQMATGSAGQQAVTVEQVRFVTPEVAAVDGSWTVTGAQDADGNELPPIEGRGFELVRKRSGQWKFIATREMVIFRGSPELPTPALATAGGDEQQLRDIQQRLARAWVERDRRTLEQLLAPEWSVATADGRVVIRSAALDQFFTQTTVAIKAMTTDEVNVTLYGPAAVVRGRTIAKAEIQATAVEIRTRFTDMCIKRGNEWIVVASHQTQLRND